MAGDSGKGWCGRVTQGALGFRQGGGRVRVKNGRCLALKQGNVATCGATSRRSREESSQRRDVGIQRRDVPESGKNQRHDVDIQRRDVPERCKTNVVTLRSHVATF